MCAVLKGTCEAEPCAVDKVQNALTLTAQLRPHCADNTQIINNRQRTHASTHPYCNADIRQYLLNDRYFNNVSIFK